MNNEVSVKFRCASPRAEHATAVHVAGSFNSWLNPSGTQINPTVENARNARLARVNSSSGVVWEGAVSVREGSHDFKFVVDGNQWIGWYEGSDYDRGNDAPGGPNFRIDVSIEGEG